MVGELLPWLEEVELLEELGQGVQEVPQGPLEELQVVLELEGAAELLHK